MLKASLLKPEVSVCVCVSCCCYWMRIIVKAVVQLGNVGLDDLTYEFGKGDHTVYKFDMQSEVSDYKNQISIHDLGSKILFSHMKFWMKNFIFQS